MSIGKRITNKINEFMSFLRESLSENGIPSSKRVLACIIILVVMFCTAFGCVKEGITEIIKSLLEVEIIVAGSLLGVTTVTNGVTSIFQKKNETNENYGDDSENEKSEGDF